MSRIKAQEKLESLSSDEILGYDPKSFYDLVYKATKSKEQAAMLMDRLNAKKAELENELGIYGVTDGRHR